MKEDTGKTMTDEKLEKEYLKYVLEVLKLERYTLTRGGYRGDRRRTVKIEAIDWAVAKLIQGTDFEVNPPAGGGWK